MMKARKYRKPIKKGMKRFSSRKQAVPRYNYDISTIKAESYHLLKFNANTNTITETATGYTYITVAKMLADSYSFTQVHANYQKYKITGIAIRASDVNTNENNVFANGAPVVAIAFFPNSSGVALGTVPAFNDAKMYVEPNLTVPQTKYWRCPNNSFPGLGVGFGVWNNTITYHSQEGQISFCNTTTTTTSSSITIISLRVTLYIQLNNRNY